MLSTMVLKRLYVFKKKQKNLYRIIEYLKFNTRRFFVRKKLKKSCLMTQCLPKDIFRSHQRNCSDSTFKNKTTLSVTKDLI